MKKKLRSVDDSYTINMYDNGFMVEYGGRDENDDWDRAKIVCNTIDEVVELVKFIATQPRSK